jgi:hypothetical protein
MLAYGSYSTFSLLHEQQKLPGSDCSVLSIITANGGTLSLGKPKSAKFASIHGVSEYKMLSNYVCSLRVALMIELSALEHTATVVNCPLFCQKCYSRGKSTAGECRRNPI